MPIQEAEDIFEIEREKKMISLDVLENLMIGSMALVLVLIIALILFITFSRVD